MATESFGRYLIKERIGQGGMATVYLAHDPRFGRDVALKVMSQAFQADPTFRGRFEREARTIATLEHPAIVPVYDVGEDHNQPYLVMRYMPGGSLAERIIQGPLSLEQALPIIRPITAALDHAHKRGIIHRDLKPGNILFDEYGNAFLSDFGIVKVSEATASLTGSGVIGTPAYMSPEQVHGEDTIDGRSDIYTLGIILFEMLTGRKPFRADTPVKLMMAHVLNPAPSILEARPDLPPAFDTIIQKTLSKKPEDRFANGHDLTEALTFTLTGIKKPPQLELPDEADPVITDLPTMVAGKVDSALPGRVDLEVDRVKPGELPPQRPFPWRWVGGGIIGLLAVAIVLYLVFNGGLIAAPEPTPPISPTAALVAQPTSSPTRTPLATRHSPLATPTPTRTPLATRPSPLATLTPTIIASPENLLIGRSAGDREIEAVRFGSGQNVVVFIGGFHAGFAPSTVTVAEEAITYFSEHIEEIPANVQVVIIANANPDSPLDPGNLSGRLNANNVDLNRNWDCRWQEDTQISGQFVAGGGGPEPFSEPEVAALREFLVEQQPSAVVFWEARVANGLVSPGSCDEEPKVSQPVADTYGEAAGYPVRDFEALTQQTVNGDSTNWLDDQEIPAISVLLQDYTQLTDWEDNLAGILAIIQSAAASE